MNLFSPCCKPISGGGWGCSDGGGVNFRIGCEGWGDWWGLVLKVGCSVTDEVWEERV